ncbi:MAG: hypothetical protein JKY37_20470 [Nannocystaceae bacterium]|nr:hypothetical protein [Nannocystaceae bacterium]
MNRPNFQRALGISLIVGGCYAGSPDSDDTAAASGTGTGGTAGDAGPSGDGQDDGPGGPDGGPDSGPGDGPGEGPNDEGPDGDETADPPVDGPLLDRLEVSDISIGNGVRPGVSNWRIWGTGSLHVAPVFTVPLSNGDTLVGFSVDSGGTAAAVARLDSGDALIAELAIGDGVELRGLAAESDEVFAALLWDPMAARIYVRRFDLAGAELSSTELTNPDNTPDDFGIGESRLEYGDGTYGAYYHVHSDSGHEGDTLKWIDAGTGAESTGWGWGCSHSMSNLLRFNPAVGSFLPACVTDCFPGTDGDFAVNAIGGIYLNHNQAWVIDVDAGCNGSVAGELGGAALAPGGWALVFNAHQAPATLGQQSYDPATMNQDIGFSPVSGALDAGPVVWLTDTAGVDEDDAAIARWQPAGDDVEQYVVGWHAAGAHMLARIDAEGDFLEGPVDLAGAARWGRRDDPFRQHAGGDVVWAWFDDPGSTSLHFARLKAQ